MRMEEANGNGTLPSCTADVKEEEQVNENMNENMMPLLATDGNTGCDISHAAEPDPTQEKLDRDYCMEATKLILDLGK